MFKGIIFDLDGTLINTLYDIAAAMNHCLEEMELPPHPVEAYRSFVGNGAVVLSQRCAAPHEEKAPQLLQHYLPYYHAHACENSHPYAGIPELLQKLHQHGIKIAVFTNKDQQDAETVLEHFFPGFSFDAIHGRQGSFPTKPDPTGALMIAEKLAISPSEILYVGDSGVDMQCAHAAGMYSVGVTWGFRTADELRNTGAKALASTANELLDLAIRGTEQEN